MFLQPQHFQQQDRFLSRVIDARANALHAYPWGFHSLVIDESALHQGKVALTSAAGIFRDGTRFAFPMDDSAPPAIDLPKDVRDERVVLAITMSRPGVAESDVEEASRSMPPRYHATDLDVADCHATSCLLYTSDAADE